MNVLIVGAGGPVAAAAIKALEPHHTLRLADIKELKSAHETLIVDITNPVEVFEAASGMDAIINCTVLRNDIVKSFDVNIRGAYNVMKAAVKHSIRRVVHTGPELIIREEYSNDFFLNADTTPRPSTGLYGLTKYLSMEVCRIFAEEHDLQVICFLYHSFRNPPDEQAKPTDEVNPFIISWEDTGEAFRLALEAESLPSNFETFIIVADLPHRKYINAKAKTLLGFKPKENFQRWWRK
jgi:nucleoside-diphosphate-sugar epimerase